MQVLLPTATSTRRQLQPMLPAQESAISESTHFTGGQVGALHLPLLHIICSSSPLHQTLPSGRFYFGVHYSRCHSLKIGCLGRCCCPVARCPSCSTSAGASCIRRPLPLKDCRCPAWTSLERRTAAMCPAALPMWCAHAVILFATNEWHASSAATHFWKCSFLISLEPVNGMPALQPYTSASAHHSDRHGRGMARSINL